MWRLGAGESRVLDLHTNLPADGGKLRRCKSDPVKTAISRHDCKNCSLCLNEACGETWNIYDDIEVNRRGTQKLCRRGFVSPKAKLSSGLPLCATWQWMKNHVKREIIFDMKIFPSIDQFVLNFIDFIKADAKHGSLVPGNKNKQILMDAPALEMFRRRRWRFTLAINF